MTQPSLDALFSAPSAVQARRSGHRVGLAQAPTLQARYKALLASFPCGLTDHAAAAHLGVLSTTVGARRIELIESGVPIVAVGRVKAGRASRCVWRLVQ